MYDLVLITPSTNFLEDQFVIPSLSTLLLKAWIEAYRVSSIKVINLNEHDNDYSKIPDAKYYGISFTTPHVPEAYKISNYLRANKKDPIIVGGGPHPSALPYDTLKRGICDMVVRGAGEWALLGLLLGSKDLNSILTLKTPGIESADENPKVMVCRPYLMNNDTYSDVVLDYSQIDYKRYKTWLIMNEIGCAYNCNFCYKMFRRIYEFPQNFITRCIEDIVTYDLPRYVKFSSDNIFINFDNFISNFKLCDTLGIEYETVGRLDNLSEERLRILKDTGCRVLKVGVETGSQRLLDLMNKREQIITMKKGFDLLDKVCINYGVYLIANYPSETMDDLKATVKFVNDLGVSYVGVSDYTPYPGTPDWYEKLAPEERSQFIEDFGSMHHLGKLKEDQMSEHKKYLLENLCYYKGKINL